MAKSIAYSAIVSFGMLAATGLTATADDTGFASIHDLRREGGRLCMSDHDHSGSGNGRTQALAQRSAIGSWASFTALEYGSSWASFGNAIEKGMNCSGGGGWSCSLAATPCRPF